MNVPLLQSPRRPDHLRERPLFGTETHFASGPITAFLWIMAAAFLFLGWGYWDLQIQNEAYYRDLAQNNRVKSLPITAVRGRIVDRDGRVIVDSHLSFKAVLTREYYKPEHLPLIVQGLGIDETELKAKLARYEKAPRYLPFVIKQDLTAADVAFIEAHKQQEMLPELDIVNAQHRVYPKQNFLAHLLGYVGEISDAELDLPQFAKSGPGDIVGKGGIERYYNDLLSGADGYRRVMINNRGKELAVLENQEAQAGRELKLTIDLELQAVAELALEGKRGAIVALDPRTGEVLAMVSRPAFDPNKFTRGLTGAEWKEIQENVEKPMFHRAIQAALAPGSTLKPLVALAALEEGVIGPGYTAHCPGYFQLAERAFKCHLRTGHGTVGLRYAMAQSCDVFFYNVGSLLGITRLHKWGDLAGLGRQTGIDLPSEETGVMPSVAWKQRRHRDVWRQGDMVNASIGQGYVAVTPLQLAHAIGGIANGGVWMRPRVVKDPVKLAGLKPVPESTRATVSPDNIRRVTDAMSAVVNGGGTAREAWLPNTEVCGKTGTAQLISNETIARRGLKGIVKDNAWFVAFAPRTNAEIVVAGLFEAGEHGASASIMVRDVIKAYFDKKNRLEWEKRAAAAPAPAKPLEAVVAVDSEKKDEHDHANEPRPEIRP